MSEQLKILFVCSGNTCRSPMAEAIARARLGPAISVMSAGAPKRSMAWDSPASPRTAEVMARRGIDISNHRSKPLEEALAGGVPDLVLTMEAKHLEQVGFLRPDLADRTFLFTLFVRMAEAAGSKHDSEPFESYLAKVTSGTDRAGASGDTIEDPIFENTHEAYEKCAAQIEDLLRRLSVLLVPDIDG